MDPRQAPPDKRVAPKSPLMAAMAKASTGEKVNACPFGCQVEDLDDNGYCDHLMGFTNDGKTMEPMVKDHRERRVVQGAHPQPVLKKDVLVQITTSSRVYRETPTKGTDAA